MVKLTFKWFLFVSKVGANVRGLFQRGSKVGIKYTCFSPIVHDKKVKTSIDDLDLEER